MIPILVVAFNRPSVTKSLLDNLLLLPKTNVYFSIDRCDRSDQGFRANEKVYEQIRNFSRTSHHSCKINFQRENVGCNRNTLLGMDYLLANETDGLLLEDDCEFRPEYLNFLNRNHDKIDYETFFSISPMNLTWSRDLSRAKNRKIVWEQSVLMGASLGLTFSRISKKLFDQALPFMGTTAMKEKIEENSRLLPVNFFQKRVLQSFFTSKSMSIKNTWDISLQSHSQKNETGWDSAWQLAAFFWDKKFLLPNFTLARETLFQIEAQWHPHKFEYPSWEGIQEKVFQIDDLDSSRLSTQKTIGRIDKWSVSRFPLRRYLQVIARKRLI